MKALDGRKYWTSLSQSYMPGSRVSWISPTLQNSVEERNFRFGEIETSKIFSCKTVTKTSFPILQSSGNLSSLTCWNDPSFAPISPLKVELLHENPRVIQVHELLHEALMENIIDAVQGRGQISRSKVHQKGLKISVSASRTSGSTWLREESLLSHLRRKVYSKLESLVGLTFRDPEGLEDFQVANYRTGGHYNPHLDNILTDEVLQTSVF